MPLNVTVIGGPADGMTVPYVGHRFITPRRRPLTGAYLAKADRLPPPRVEDDHHELRHGDDGQLFYVHESLIRHDRHA